MAAEETEGQDGIWDFELCKLVGCNACAANVRIKDFWQFAKPLQDLVSPWLSRGCNR